MLIGRNLDSLHKLRVFFREIPRKPLLYRHNNNKDIIFCQVLTKRLIVLFNSYNHIINFIILQQQKIKNQNKQKPIIPN